MKKIVPLKLGRGKRPLAKGHNIIFTVARLFGELGIAVHSVHVHEQFGIGAQNGPVRHRVGYAQRRAMLRQQCAVF